jgi:hypothetical protein
MNQLRLRTYFVVHYCIVVTDKIVLRASFALSLFAIKAKRLQNRTILHLLWTFLSGPSLKHKCNKAGNNCS